MLNVEADCILTHLPDLPTNTGDKDYWKKLQSQFGNKRKGTDITINTIPVGEGACSYAFRIYD